MNPDAGPAATDEPLDEPPTTPVREVIPDEPPRTAAPPAMPPAPRVEEPPAAAVTHAWEQPLSEQPVPPWRRGAAFRSGEDASAGGYAGSGPPESQQPAGPAGAGPTPGTAGLPPVVSGRPAPVSGSTSMVRVPILLSDWCAGIGALLAVVAMLLPWRVLGGYTNGWGLASAVNVLYTLVVLGVLAVIFLPDLLPRVPQRALLLLSVGLVGVGIGLDRLGQPLTGAGGILFLIAALGIALGGAIAQLGQDRPVGGPQA